LFALEEWRKKNKIKNADAVKNNFGLRSSQSCWIIPRWNTAVKKQTIEVYQEWFELRPEYITAWIFTILICTSLTFRNYFYRYREEPTEMQTIQLTSRLKSSSDAVVEHSI